MGQPLNGYCKRCDMPAVEIYEALVLKEEWEKVKKGDKEAITKMRAEFDGMELYFHILSWDVLRKDTESVSLSELCDKRIIETVTLTAYSES